MFQIIQRQTTHTPQLKPGRLADPEVLSLVTQEIESRSSSEALELSRLFSRVLHDIRIGGAWKRTNEGRLGQTESALARNIDPRHRTDLRLLDLGASDGITTVELVRHLRSAFNGDVQADLADLNLWLYRYRFGSFIEYRAADGEPVMVRCRRLGLRLAQQTRTNSNERDFLTERYLGLRRFRSRMKPDGRISLVSPVALKEPGIKPIEINCLDFNPSLRARYTAIRASNVLNLGYFTLDQVSLAAGHLHAFLQEGGCLLVSRNEDCEGGERENGSLWIKRLDKFDWIEDFGTGSEVKVAIDGWRSREQPAAPVPSSAVERA